MDGFTECGLCRPRLHAKQRSVCTLLTDETRNWVRTQLASVKSEKIGPDRIFALHGGLLDSSCSVRPVRFSCSVRPANTSAWVTGRPERWCSKAMLERAERAIARLPAVGRT